MSGWFGALNTKGQVARGHNVVSVDGVVLGEGISPKWYTDTQLMVKKFDDKLYFMDPVTGVTSIAHDAAVIAFSAGGSKYAIRQGSIIHVATSREGQQAWVEEHNGQNGDRSVFVEGKPVIEHQPVDWCRIEGGHVVWSHQASGQVWGQNMATNTPVRLQLANEREFVGVPIPTPNGMWILTMTNTELRLAPWGGDEGYIITLGEDQNLNPDAVYLNGVIRVVWNTSNGIAGQQDVDLSKPRTKLLQTQPEPIPVEGNMIKSFERPFWLAPFYSHSERYGDTTDHVGNSILLVGDDETVKRELARVKGLGIPLILEATALPAEELNTVAAWWTAGLDIAELGQRVEETLTLTQRPIAAYLDKGEADAWPEVRPSWVTDRVWPSVQAYRNAGESLQAFDARVTFALQRVSKYGCMGLTLTPAFYTRNGSVPVSDITECMPLYEKWMWEFNIVCVMPFADRRPTGMEQHKELREHARAFQYAVPSTRPNRFDYWKPASTSAEEILKNKLGQSRAAVVLEPYLRELILNLVEGEGSEPQPGPEPPSNGNQASEELALMQQMKNEHPNINSCDESSLDNGRALLVDWAAQRLNKRAGKVIWGRKSRGKPNGDVAVNPNTDGLTYLRTDGRFEIIDVFNGSSPCDATWHNYGPFSQGENGWWAPPQLPKETCHGS